MLWLFLFVAFLLIVAVLLIRARRPHGGDDGYPYTRNRALFSPAERSFLGVLEQAAAGDYRVMGKVRVADVIHVQPMADRRLWQRAFNRIRKLSTKLSAQSCSQTVRLGCGR